MPVATCPNCQARLKITDVSPGGEVMCPQCRARVAVEPSAATRPADEPRVRTAGPLSLDDADPLDDDAPASRGGTRALVGLLVVFLVLLAAGGGVAAWYFTRDAKNPNDPAPEQAAAKPEDPKPKPEDPKAKDPPTQEPAAKALTGEQVNLRLLKSAVFIVTSEKTDKGQRISAGSGSLVHKDRRLVITNYHVVREYKKVAVFFPAYGLKGELITEPAYYDKNFDQVGIVGTVVARDPKLDLAIVELEKLPFRVAALPLAAKTAATGSTVFSIGASGIELRDFSGALWRLSTGTVRGRHREKVVFPDQTIEAMVLETQKPINSGDSGGPTVNDRGELVAVVSISKNANESGVQQDLVKWDIDLTEVRAYLAGYAKTAGWEWEDLSAAPPVSPDNPVEEITPSLLVSRSKTGTVEARAEALRQLATMGPAARAVVPTLIELLDSPDEIVRRGAAAALEKIGLPAKEDLGAVGKALAGPGKHGRLYALNYHARVEKATREQLAHLVKALDDKDAEVREAALRAIVLYGPTSKPEAFAQLLARTTDTDPAVAALATQVLLAFAPFDGSERDVLVTNLTHREARLRLISVAFLTTSAADEATALKWFEPRLQDEAAPVRAAAIPALAKWGVGAKRTLPVLIRLAGDEDGAVRSAAVRALGAVGNGPGVVEALARHLGPDALPAVRELAIRSLLRLELEDPKTDLPVLVSLLKSDDVAVKAAALAKLPRFGPAAKELLPQITDSLKSDDPALQLPALKAAAAIGADAAALAPRAAELVVTKPRLGAPPATAALTGEEVNLRLLKSSVFILAGDSLGSGALLDKTRRLVITNYHVVGANSSTSVFFPAYGPKGELITTASTYTRNGLRLRARVVASDPRLDLALLELERIPDPIIALPLAAKPAATGGTIYSIGGSGVDSGALWRLSAGTVRGRHKDSYGYKSGQKVEAMVLETQSPVNPGDSGGPTVNDRGELVGVVASFDTRERLVSQSIDITEVRSFLEAHAKRGGWAWDDGTAAPPPAVGGVLTGESVQLQAIETLDQLTPKSAELLVQSLEPTIPSFVAVRLCEVLGKRGGAVPQTAVPRFLLLAEKNAEARPAAGDALGRIGGDEVFKFLAERTYWAWKTLPDGRKVKDSKHALDLQVWAIQTMGKLNPKLLTEKQQANLAERMDTIVRTNPDIPCRKEAESSRAKLQTAGLKAK